MVHFTKDEVKSAIRKVYAALNPGGIFAFSVKQRTENAPEWKANVPGSDLGRYFSYWEAEEIETELQRIGFRIKGLAQNRGMCADWLDFIAQK